jgi:hypothetical protein
MNTTFDYLFHTDSPWIYVGSGEPERKIWIPSYFYSREGIAVCVRRLRGKKMRTTAALMDEFAASLQFFEGFGENWYALSDCLSCLDEWLPADTYILVVEGAEELLQDESSEQLAALIKTLHDAGEWWSKPVADNDRFNRNGIPFHVLLNVAETGPSAADRICQIAAEANVPVRR